MLVWHLKRSHGLNEWNIENNVDFDSLKLPIEEVPKNDHVLIWANKKADMSLTPVYCRSCGELIAQIEKLVTPTTFKIKYGEFCGFCGASLGNTFGMKDD